MDGDAPKKRDTRLFDFLSQNKKFIIDIEKEKKLISKKDFLKLYLLSENDGVNFPLLNNEQQEIVNTEDKNILVQGVAGSGKTNICLNKLVQTALREYGGRVLYSTYSKSLLLDIKNKLEIYKQNVKNLNQKLKEGKVVFVDDNHIKAVENALGGIWLDVESGELTQKLDKIENFLDTHIDLFLIEDLAEKYSVKSSGNLTDERYFIKEYIPNIKNYQLASKFEKIKYLSYEIIYKEIYGNIFGMTSKDILTNAEYKDIRKNSFTNFECDTIYSIAQDYLKHLQKNNLEDNNILTKKLLKMNLQKYSLTILDEVQDFTQVNLTLFKKISRKMFCVGDALQMINPSYFSFATLKNLMFGNDGADVKQLKNNYRNSKRIDKIVQVLSDINTKQFGVHNFVLRSNSVDNNENSKITSKTYYYLSNDNSYNYLNKNEIENLTFVCSSNEEKTRLKKYFKEAEILTVSEIKGIERNSVILVDILSSNFEKWQALERNIINKKISDENSVYRYYFNLLYVGITRAKQNLYVIESKKIKLFEDMFKNNFDVIEDGKTLKAILKDENINSKITSEELLDRIDEFIKFRQYDNALFVAKRLNDNYESIRQINKINAYKEWDKTDDYRKLGIELWKNNFIDEAKTQFRLSGDEILIKLIDACRNNSDEGISGDIIQFLPLVSENQVATSLIIDTIKNEINNLKSEQKRINEKLKIIKG